MKCSFGIRVLSSNMCTVFVSEKGGPDVRVLSWPDVAPPSNHAEKGVQSGTYENSESPPILTVSFDPVLVSYLFFRPINM